MRIIVFSDTHKDISICIDVLNNACADMFIHLGDVYSDYSDLSAVFSDIKSEVVYGNNEPYFGKPPYKIVEAQEYKILITHGHHYNVKSELNTLAKLAKEVGADIALFGHTHKSFDGYVNGIHMLNPGTANKRYGYAEYGVIEIEEGRLKTAVIKV